MMQYANVGARAVGRADLDTIALSLPNLCERKEYVVAFQLGREVRDGYRWFVTHECITAVKRNSYRPAKADATILLAD